jgi:UbiD family decarboxylase
MNYHSLRDFLGILEQNGQLVRIADAVMPEPDISAAAQAAINCGHYAPALLFENEWEMYICNECNFTWRSTEPENIRNPKMYDPKFKLTKKKISMMMVNPPVATSKK